MLVLEVGDTEGLPFVPLRLRKLSVSKYLSLSARALLCNTCLCFGLLHWLVGDATEVDGVLLAPTRTVDDAHSVLVNSVFPSVNSLFSMRLVISVTYCWRLR